MPSIVVSTSILPAASMSGQFPARVQVIDRTGLHASTERTLSHAMRTVAGVSTYDDLGAETKLTLALRGFSVGPVVGVPQGLTVFVDGIPVNEADAGEVNLDLLPLEAVASIEVVRGTVSLLGPNSLGGAVNLVTEKGGAGVPGAELSIGSYGLRELGVDAGGARGQLRYFARGSWSDEDGWRQHTDARRILGVANIEQNRGSATMRFQLIGATTRASTAGSLPASVYAIRPDSNLTAGDFEDMKQLQASLSWSASRRGSNTSASIYGRVNDAERFNVNQLSDPDVRGLSSNRTLGLQSDWSFARSMDRGVLTSRTGVGASATATRIRIFAERLDPGLTTHVQSPIGRLNAFSSLDYSTGAVTLSAAARYDLVRVPFHNRIDGARDTTSLFQRVSPRVGARVAIAPSASAYASIARGFRAPALIELACADPNEPCALPFALGDDPPLAPVVATTAEIGATWTGTAASLAASAYRTEVRDDIFLFPYDDASAPTASTIEGYFANVARTRREGIELTGDMTVRRTALYASYAWSRATFRVNDVDIFSIREDAGGSNVVESGDRLPLVPSHTFAAGASAPLASSVSVGVDARYTGRRYLRGDEANEEAPLAGFWVTGGYVAVERSGWEVRLAGRNLLDDHAASFGTFNVDQSTGTVERFLTPIAPRSIDVTVRRRLR